MKKLTVCIVSLALSAFAGKTAAANFADWNGHAAPFTFLFGNEFDTHQQSQIWPNNALTGFLYISYNGIVTSDGFRVASHADCNAVSDCTVGWTFSGKLRDAEFLYHIMDDHPVFLLARDQIPQPGSYVHFHRVGANEESSGSGYAIELFAIQRFCFIHHNANTADPNKTCQGNGGVPVVPGIDTASHLNIVASAPRGM
jgi:hypothetical protein